MARLFPKSRYSGIYPNNYIHFLDFYRKSKNRDRFLGKLARRFKCKATGDFSFEAYITGTVRKKIAENTAVKDVLPISNPTIAGFGQKIKIDNCYQS